MAKTLRKNESMEDDGGILIDLPELDEEGDPAQVGAEAVDGSIFIHTFGIPGLSPAQAKRFGAKLAEMAERMGA